MAFFFALVPSLINLGVSEWMTLVYRTSPIENYFALTGSGIVASDVHLSKSHDAILQFTRTSADSYPATRYMKLTNVELIGAGGETIRHAEIGGQKTNLVLLKGKQTISLTQNLDDWLNSLELKKRYASSAKSTFVWVLHFQITLPYGVVRTVSYQSNLFYVTNP